MCSTCGYFSFWIVGIDGLVDDDVRRRRHRSDGGDDGVVVAARMADRRGWMVQRPNSYRTRKSLIDPFTSPNGACRIRPVHADGHSRTGDSPLAPTSPYHADLPIVVVRPSIRIMQLSNP